ncbi:MAG: right-handed parallel beta-helix repeat-containing protein [Bacteroidota bacterium]
MKFTPCLSLSLLLLIVGAAPVLPATYYVSSSMGSDANDGLADHTPWKSIARVNAAGLVPGDSLLFKRGDIWKDGVLLSFTESGTAEQPIIVAAYGVGSRPVISDITLLDGSGDSLNWIRRSGNIWSMRCPETPNRLWLDGVEVLRAAIAEDVGTTNSEGSFESWYYSTADSLLFLYAAQNPAHVYRSVEGNRPAGVMALYRSAYIIFDGIDFRGGRWSTIYGGACSFITFRDCCIGYGRSGLTLTSADTSASAHDVLIERCTFDSGLRFRYGLSSLGPSGTVDATKRGSEDGIHFGDAVSNCIVRHCSFTGWGHVAINCYAPDSTRSGVYANVFHDNTFTGSNISYARPFATDGAEGKCHHNEFRNNVMKDHTVRSQINGNDNWVHNNIFDGMTTSPAKYFSTDGSGQGVVLSVYGLHLVCHDNRIENNLFLRTSEAAVALWSHGFPHKVRNNLVRNNLIFDAGYATARAADSGIAVLLRDTLEVFGNTVQNNCMFSPRAPESSAVKYYGTAMSVTDFNRMDGRHGNVLTGNLQSDPLFIDYIGGDYHLLASSPCIDAGIRVPDITHDLDGNPVFSGAAPDIGPYEYTGPSAVRSLAVPSVRSTVHPNPCRAAATITLHSPVRHGTLLLYNFRGGVVMDQRDLCGVTFTLRTGQLPRGIYYFTVAEHEQIIAAGLMMKE